MFSSYGVVVHNRYGFPLDILANAKMNNEFLRSGLHDGFTSAVFSPFHKHFRFLPSKLFFIETTYS